MANELLTDWRPSAESRLFAAGVAAAGIDVEVELKKFRSYAHRNPLRDPDRAYVAWLKKAIGFNAEKGAKTSTEQGQSRQTENEREVAQIKRFNESNPAEFERLRKYMENHRWWECAARSFQITQMLGAIYDRDMIFAFLEDEGREF